MRSIEVEAVPTEMDAHGEALVIATPAIDRIEWRRTESLEVVDTAEVDGMIDVKLGPGNRAYVLREDSVRVVDPRRQRVLIEGLKKATRLGVDSGEVFVFETGGKQQISRFSSSGRREATFGREGGRAFGPYVATDFRNVGDIEPDREGGFIITENSSAPRRTAHFDREGNLVNEWYGGQQFYTFASPDPEDPSIVWMDSEWHWLMKVKADYDAGTWEVLETYSWTRDLQGLSTYKMAERMHVVRRDLDGDGETEPLLWSEAHLGLLLRPVPEEGKLLPFAVAGHFSGNVSDEVREAWYGAIRKLGEDPENANVRRGLTGFTWADANGDGKYQADELRLFSLGGHGFDGPGEHRPQGRCDLVDGELNLWYAMNWGADKNRSDVKTMPARGYTEIGAPIWDWNDFHGVTPRNAISPTAVDVRVGPDGSIYQLSHGPGDGYVAKGYNIWEGHGFGWPGNLIAQSHFIKWAPDHKTMLFNVGHNAALLDQLPGQLHYPEEIMGIAYGCVFIADKIVNPIMSWTTDGLYHGQIFDRRADDGLPDSVYAWFREDAQFQTGERGSFQYDMKLGGSIADEGDGSILFFGAGLNNVPVFRISGFDEIQRQSGSIDLAAPTTRTASLQGTGLRGTYFASGDFSGNPIATRVDEQLWIGFRPGGDTVEARADSVVWEGYIEPRFTDDYSFLVYTGNDNRHAEPVRLYVDDELILDTASEPTRYFKHRSDRIRLHAGEKVAIRLEYQNTAKQHGQMHLSWESASQPVEHVPTEAMYPPR
ncbi:MAG: PA14 domain-containing protein [Phycisphaeraceae bacterium]